MKFTVVLSQLRKAVSFASAVIKNNPAVPVLENIHCSVSGGILSLRTTDLYTTLATTCEVNTLDTGTFLMPAKKTGEILAALPDQPVTLTIDTEAFGITLTHNSGKVKITGENPVDFPLTPKLQGLAAVALDADGRGAFIDALESTAYACSTDELRPAMTGIFLDNSTEGLLKMVGVNGFSMAVYPCETPDADRLPSVIIPKSFSDYLLKTNRLVADDVAMTLTFSPANLQVELGPYTMTGRLIDAKFPEYYLAIPKACDKSVTVNRMELIAAIKRVMLTANATLGLIRFSCRQGEDLQISSDDLDYGYESHEMVKATVEGDEIEIGFNGKTILNTLSHMREADITINLQAPNRAGIITGSTDHALCLIMPQLINTYA